MYVFELAMGRYETPDRTGPDRGFITAVSYVACVVCELQRIKNNSNMMMMMMMKNS